MSTSQCAVYQVKDTPEYRDVRFRSYEKLKSEGRTVQIENYQQVYIGRIQPGETPADIKLRLQKQRPKNFKGHSIGCSDVIIITDDGILSYILMASSKVRLLWYSPMTGNSMHSAT